MKLNVFDVVLTNNEAVYFAGQTLQGHVILELAKTAKVKGIRMVFHGKAFVHWTEQSMRGPGETRHREIRHHSATEEYFDVSQPLLTKAPGHTHQDEERLLEAGQYTYPFQFQIPAHSPTSFEGQYGFIRYWVKVTIERPWKDDVSVKKPFSVICPVDLNLDSSAGQPIQNEKEKRLCCLCCTSGPITAALRLSHKGYVPGETVYVNAEVNNWSRRKVGGTSVELLMTTTFHTPTKSRAVTQQVARLHHGSLPSGSVDSWEGERLVLPSLPPSYMIGCDIIDVRYTLELRVFPVGPAFELAVPVEILVGTVPLHSTLEYFLTLNQMTPPTPRGHIRGGASNVAEENRVPPYLPPTFASSPMCQFHLRDDGDEQCTILDGQHSPRYINFSFHLHHKQRHQQHQAVRFAT